MENIPEELRVYTVQEAMEILKIERSSIIKYMKSGKLKSIRIGTGNRGLVRIRHKDLVDFINESVRDVDQDSKS